MMENILKELLYNANLADKIVELLPDEEHNGYTILSMAIDKYSSRIGRSSREVWKMMYTVAMAVHDEDGDY